MARRPHHGLNRGSGGVAGTRPGCEQRSARAEGQAGSFERADQLTSGRNSLRANVSGSRAGAFEARGSVPAPRVSASGIRAHGSRSRPDDSEPYPLVRTPERADASPTSAAGRPCVLPRARRTALPSLNRSTSPGSYRPRHRARDPERQRLRSFGDGRTREQTCGASVGELAGPGARAIEPALERSAILSDRTSFRPDRSSC